MPTFDPFALLLDAAVKSVPILTVALLVLFAARRASAATRHMIGTLTLAALLLLPILSATLPAWRVDLSGIVASNTLPSSDPKPAPATAPIPAADPSGSTSDLAAPHALAAVYTSAPPTGGAPIRRLPTGWQTWVSTLYLLAAAALLVRIAGELLAVRRLTRGAVPITDGPWMQALAAEGRGVRVRLLASEELAVPVTCGILRPVVLLPTDAAAWPEGERRLILAHELAHVRRRDCLWQLIAHLACAVYWFNPLVWLVNRRAALDREQASDDAVLTSGAVQPSDYAQTLLNFARRLSPSSIPQGALAMTRTSQLEPRVRAILSGTLRRHTITRRTIMVVAVLLIGLLLPIAMLRATDEVPHTGDAPRAGAALDAFTHRVDFELGDIEFYAGDNIQIEEVRGTRPTFEQGGTYLITGRYRLASRDEARLAVFVTATKPTEGKSRIHPGQTLDVRRGSGEFALTKTLEKSQGHLHLSFYPLPSGHAIGGIYLGHDQGAFPVLRYKKWNYRQAAGAGEAGPAVDAIGGGQPPAGEKAIPRSLTIGKAYWPDSDDAPSSPFLRKGLQELASTWKRDPGNMRIVVHIDDVNDGDYQGFYRFMDLSDRTVTLRAEGHPPIVAEFWKASITAPAEGVCELFLTVPAAEVAKMPVGVPYALEPRNQNAQVVWKVAPGVSIARRKPTEQSPTAERASVLRQPPVVVQTLPEAGRDDIDPGVTEIRVTYSQAMMDGSWSWSTDTSLGEFPETTGKPRYLEDGRTCVLPVKLKPGTTYAIRLNSNNFHNFKDAEGRPAEPYLLTFKTRD